MLLGLPVQLLAADEAATPAGECDFRCTLQQHLDAIQAHDFPRFAATITQDSELIFILPSGKYMSSRAEYLEAIEGWFQETGWHFEYEVVQVRETPAMGLALLLVHYSEDDRGGQPYHLDHYLSLAFEKQDGQWRLVHDQNTGITK